MRADGLSAQGRLRDCFVGLPSVLGRLRSAISEMTYASLEDCIILQSARRPEMHQNVRYTGRERGVARDLKNGTCLVLTAFDAIRIAQPNSRLQNLTVSVIAASCCAEFVANANRFESCRNKIRRTCALTQFFQCSGMCDAVRLPDSHDRACANALPITVQCCSGGKVSATSPRTSTGVRGLGAPSWWAAGEAVRGSPRCNPALHTAARTTCCAWSPDTRLTMRPDSRSPFPA